MVVDAPTLYETGQLLPLCSSVICVGTTLEQQLAWLSGRNDLTEAETKVRVDAQFPLGDKLRRSNLPIMNTSSKEVPPHHPAILASRHGRLKWRRLFLRRVGQEFVRKVHRLAERYILTSCRTNLSHLFRPIGVLAAGR